MQPDDQGDQGQGPGAMDGIDHAPVAFAECAPCIEDDQATAQVLGAGKLALLFVPARSDNSEN